MIKLFTKLIIITAQNPAHKPLISIPGMKLAARKRSPIFITTVKSPRERIISGKDNNLTIGRTRALIAPKIAPAIKNSFHLPWNEKPLTKWLAVQMAAAFARIWTIILERKLI